MNDRPLKILHLASHGTPQRGGAVQLIRLARGLAERGHRVTALFNAASPAALDGCEEARRAAAAGVTVEAFPLSGPGAAEALRRCWRAGAFDVLHVHREAALLLAGAALAGERVPCFIAQRGTIYLPDWFSAEHRLLLSRRVHRIVAVARAVKRSLAWRRLIPPGKIEVVYGGVQRDLFHPGVSPGLLRQRRGVPAGACVITLPGALVEKKGTEYFIQAADRIRRQRQGVRFWIVGEGKRERELKALAESLGLGAQVDFLGHVDAMPEVYAASDLVVCASVKGEGLTGTLREALAMARPVVTTAVAGNTELVAEGVTGYVARPADGADLARAILRALADPARAQALAEAGRQRVLAWCDEPVRSARMETIYRTVLGDPPARRATGHAAGQVEPLEG
jgi:glycosyltransferase involved in cell wall biosynthesis